jgi:hypothetical protein
MKKRLFLFALVGVPIVAASFGLGYTHAYVQGLAKTIDAEVTTHSSILLVDSHTLTRALRSLDAAELIEAVEANGDSLANFLIISSKPVLGNPETRRQVEIALTAWEKAKERLQELRRSQSKNANDSPK